MTTKTNKSSVLPLKPLIWHDASGVAGVYSEKTESYIKDALWFCSTLVAEYVIRKSPDGIGFVVNYGGRTENSYDTVEEAKEWCEFTHYKDKMKPYILTNQEFMNMRQTTLDTHFNNFTQWSTDRKIIQNGNVLAQGLKLVSEVGELADNLAKGCCIKDDIGDCCVVLNNLVHMQGLTLDECLEQAWNDIKDRKGEMNQHGVFIKDSDIEK